jgi:hypothetical protein
MSDIHPRCLEHKNHNVFVSPDGYLRPCCYVNNSLDWDEFLMWVSENDLDIKDLELIGRGMDEIVKTPLWTTLKKQLEDRSPNCPSVCKKVCGKPTSSNLHKIRTY